MSDELLSHRDQMARPLHVDEKRLVHALIEKAVDLQLPDGWVDRVMVVSMDDGGMGSLHFLSSSSSIQKMGRQASEICFNDEDGVTVIASLNLDESGLPFELDVWKTDFTPLIRLPHNFD